jgi:hypothetical protein
VATDSAPPSSAVGGRGRSRRKRRSFCPAGQWCWIDCLGSSGTCPKQFLRSSKGPGRLSGLPHLGRDVATYLQTLYVCTSRRLQDDASPGKGTTSQSYYMESSSLSQRATPTLGRLTSLARSSQTGLGAQRSKPTNPERARSSAGPQLAQVGGSSGLRCCRAFVNDLRSVPGEPLLLLLCPSRVGAPPPTPSWSAGRLSQRYPRLWSQSAAAVAISFARV